MNMIYRLAPELWNTYLSVYSCIFYNTIFTRRLLYKLPASVCASQVFLLHSVTGKNLNQFEAISTIMCLKFVSIVINNRYKY